MKGSNLTIILTIIAAFGVSIFAFQPAATIEASSSATPVATPSPRTKRPKTIQSPKPIQSPITKTKTKSSGVKEGGANDTTFRTRKPKKPNNFQEVSGIGMEATGVKKNRKRKSSKSEAAIETLERKKQPRKRRK